MSGDVTSGRIPGEVGDAVVFTGTKKLDVRSWLGLTTVRVVVGGEVKVPELDIVLGRRGKGGERNVSTLR